MRTLKAHFDGKHVVLDEPACLQPNTKVRVIVPQEGETAAALVECCTRMSETTFNSVWNNPLDADYDKL